MDIFSHALWGGVTVGRKNAKYFLWAALISIFPDAVSFGVLMIARILGLVSGPDWSSGHPNVHQIPSFVNILYNISHSLIIFGLVFLIVWFFLKKPFWPLLAWGLHILIDIPSHSSAFFPTPFLWPVSNFKINGISWGEPVVFIPNLIFLILLYSAWGISYYREKHK